MSIQGHEKGVERGDFVPGVEESKKGERGECVGGGDKERHSAAWTGNVFPNITQSKLPTGRASGSVSG